MAVFSFTLSTVMGDSQQTVQKIIFELKERPQKIFKIDEVYSEPNRASKMEFSGKRVSRLGVLLGSEYASEMLRANTQIKIYRETCC